MPLAAEEEKPKAEAKAGNDTKVEVATTFRSSELIGMAVRNREGKDLGKIEDMVVELNSGDIRYAALSFGGFAGFGDKLFAVPWQSMTFKFGEDDRYFVFDVTPQQLERSPGFDQNNWPDVADPAWAASIDKHYKIDRSKPAKTTTSGDRPATRTTERTAENPPDKPTVEKPTNAPVVYDAVFRVSTLKGMKVRNDRGENLGAIDEMVFDIRKGSAKYAALSFGGVAGFGTKLFAIPMSAMTLKHAADETFFVLNVSPERLKDAPGFDKDHWPDTADPKWAAEIDKYYADERTAKRPTSETNK
jgi:sporulation protein YlmC with PRC-barrel domain